MEHLVMSHLGGHYISDADPEFIEAYCETCGDSDCIVASWNPEEENGRINGLLRYLMGNVLNNREDIDRKVEEYTGLIDIEDLIPSLLNDIEYDSDEVFTIVSYLLTDREISDEEYNRIMHASKFQEERQTKMIKHFAKDMFAKDENGKVKVIKLNKN